MTALHRQARFELLVAAATALAVAALFVWSRNLPASLAGFALLALPAFRHAARGGAGPLDERDRAIQQRAAVAGYSALWLGLVVWGVGVPLQFSDQGSVPLAWVTPVLWVAWWLVIVVRAITILVLDERGV